MSFDGALKIKSFKGLKSEGGDMSCPLCNSDEAKMEKKFQQNQRNISFLFNFNCPCCAEFDFSENALECLLYDPDLSYVSTQKHLISGYTREAAVESRNPPILTLESLSLIKEQAPSSVSEKVDKILLNLSKMTLFPGKEISIIEHLDYPLGYCKNEEEFSYFIKYLEDASLLEKNDSSLYRLTVKGWEKVEALRKTSASSNQVFVAMNFDKGYIDCYKSGIAEALNETNYKPYRVDQEEHVERVDDKILSEIKKSKFIIADFTGQKHGVYFEAGYALGLGIPVIWTCHEDDIKTNKLHFDTRQFNHIVWADEKDIKEKLINRIRVVIGENL